MQNQLTPFRNTLLGMMRNKPLTLERINTYFPASTKWQAFAALNSLVKMGHCIEQEDGSYTYLKDITVEHKKALLKELMPLLTAKRKHILRKIIEEDLS